MDPSAWMERLRQDDHEALEQLLTHYDGMLRYMVPSAPLTEASPILPNFPSDGPPRRNSRRDFFALLWKSRARFDTMEKMRRKRECVCVPSKPPP